MRKPDKPHLRRALVDGIEDEIPSKPKTDQFVLDGRALLHKVRWVNGETYKETALRYVEYVTKKLGTACIVFDGYGISCTKDHEHQRRSTKKTSSNITIEEENKAYGNQEAFLAYSNNKT